MLNKNIAYYYLRPCHLRTSLAGVLLLLLVSLVCACSSGSDDGQLQPTPSPDITDPTQYLPLTFNAATADKESYSTRASQTGADAASTIGGSFAVYGVKLMSSSSDYAPQTVFNQTPVTYASGTAGTTSSNTADWEYVSGDEYIRYWDQLAEGYVFFGYAPSSLKDATGDTPKATASLGVPTQNADLDKTKGTVTISNLQGGAVSPTTNAYLSLPTVKNPRVGTTSYQGAATMTFQQPLARIRIGFISGEYNYNAYDGNAFYITDVSFAPVKSNTDTNNDGTPDAVTIITKGSVTATYTWSYQVNSSTPPSFVEFGCDLEYTFLPTTPSDVTSSLAFNNYSAYANAATHYTLTADQYVENALFAYATETEGDVTTNTPASESDRIEKQWFYVFPQQAAEWRLSIKTTANGVDSEKTAVVPARYMGWQPNHQYTYIFKVSPTNLSIVGVDVKVTDWAEGGSAESEQHHW